MSKFSIVCMVVSLVFLFATVIFIESSLFGSVCCLCATILFGLPSIIEDKCIRDREYEREVNNEI